MSVNGTNGNNGSNGHARKRTASQEVIDLSRALETKSAERDAALAAVLALREAFCLSGGYMTPTQQRVLRDVETMLEERGLLKRKHQSWTNRT